MTPSKSESLSTTSCSCSNKCLQFFENLTSDHGLMIALNVPDSTTKCTCLKLHPEVDANLAQFHPNIYIPRSLLDYPDRLVKYGGGGSGVTVFGGYHPLLGSLVMKHGGYKDLVELVSLAQIDRELSTRAHWMIDSIKNESMKDINEESKDKGQSSSIKQKLYGISKMMSSNILNNKSSTKRMGGLNNITAKSHDGITSIMKSINMRSLKKESTNDSMPSPLDGFDEQQAQAISKEVQIQNIHNARDNMKKCIPSFRMIYISPMHVRERREELINSSFLTPGSKRTRSKDSIALGTVKEDEDEDKEDGLVKDLFDKKEVKERNVFDSLVSSTESSMASITSPSPPTSNQNGITKLVRRHSSVLRKGRTLHLFGSSSTKASSFEVEDDHVDMCFGGSYHYWKDDDGQDGSVEDESKKHSCRSQADGSDGYSTLMAFVDHLHAKQLYHEWKVTLAQQQIGSSADGSQSSPTASSLLVKGKLHGPLLHHLIDSEIQIIRNLQSLTMPEEENVVDQVRSEYEEIVASQEDSGCMISAAEVSSLADDFVGKAIKKNFDPIGGALCSERRGKRGARIGKASRFVMLRQFGIDLRQGNIHLKPQEVIPAKHLEHLFYTAMATAKGGLDGWREDNGSSTSNGEAYNSKRHTVLEETFNMHYRDDSNHGSCCSDDYNHPIFASGLDQWQSLLCLAVSMKHPNATNRIWNCGLSDGGLHNMFLSEDDIWLFDLGEPSLEPIPAFLTKFLMSFFHTLGMEEDDKGDWVIRFEQDDSGKLQLTQQTKDILPKVMEAFNITMDRLINEVFGGEEEVRLLLLRYVITQLISDAAFCIEKWRTKGGGDESRSDHQYYLEKWLWRALWDVYASEEIRRRYLVQMIMKTTRRRDTETRNLNSLDDLEE